jgi:ElaA protein
MLSWSVKKFDDLTVEELYAILQLRNLVFAIEQNCVYPDLDDKDQSSYHLMCWSEGLRTPSEQNKKLVAYTRIVPPAVIYKEPSIGRVVTAAAVRGTGIGKELMNRSITCIEELYGKIPIRIGAQVYLQKFYTDLGFQNSGDTYIEDGIPHIEMIKS